VVKSKLKSQKIFYELAGKSSINPAGISTLSKVDIPNKLD